MTFFGKPAGKQYSAPPAMQIDPSKNYVATIHTSRGDIQCQLFAEAAPVTVNNFVFLAKDGFYDGVKFHRVIPDFMVQTGDRVGNPPGTGGPGYKFADEVSPRNIPHRHRTGSLSMANSGPNSNGSQFFITHSPQGHLDGKHTVFGQVLSGQNVVDAIQQNDVITSVDIAETA